MVIAQTQVPTSPEPITPAVDDFSVTGLILIVIFGVAVIAFVAYRRLR